MGETTRRRLLCATSAVLTVGLAGCGDDEDGGNDSDNGTDGGGGGGGY
jgi:hypothetical protein